MSTNNKTIVAPSILAADWARLEEEIKNVDQAGADWLHLDVMDGSFVPEITFGTKIVEVAARSSNLPLDVHLMINSPEDHVKRFIDAGASRITFHIEACRHAHRLAQHITELGAKPGIALNPGTSVNSIEPLLSVVDLVLLMTVNPGWGGQAFIPNSLSRLELAKSLIEQAGTDIILQVDGGISAKTAEAVRNAGANSLVAGTAVFKSDNYAAAIKIIGGR